MERGTGSQSCCSFRLSSCLTNNTQHGRRRGLLHSWCPGQKKLKKKNNKKGNGLGCGSNRGTSAALKRARHIFALLHGLPRPLPSAQAKWCAPPKRGSISISIRYMKNIFSTVKSCTKNKIKDILLKCGAGMAVKGKPATRLVPVSRTD